MGLSQDPVKGEQVTLVGPAGNTPFVVLAGNAQNGVAIFACSQTPNAVVTANPGSIALDVYGALWIKATGAGNTGWVQVNAAATPSVNATTTLTAVSKAALTRQGAPSAVAAAPATTPTVSVLPGPSDPLSVVGQYINIPSTTAGIAGIGYYFRAPLTGSGAGYWFQDTTQSPTVSDTHANRASHPASGYAVGTVYYETDTGVSYCVQIPSPSNVKTWLYYNGIAQDVLANIPGTLGVNDIGYLFRASDYLHNWLWTGLAWSFIAAAQAGLQGGSLPGTTVFSAGGPPFGGAGALWHLCDGATVNVSQENGTVVATALPTIANTYFVR